MKKRIISALICVAVMLSTVPVFAAELPHEFWGLNDKYTAALDSNNHAHIAQYASEIIDLISKEPKTQQTVDIISSRAYKAGFAYYHMGDYENAAKYFELFIPYGIEQNWDDGVTIAQEFVKQLPTELEVYKYMDSEGTYFGAKNEPHGVLYGQVSEQSEDGESMMLTYIEYGDTDIFGWTNARLEEAEREGKAVELALNFPREGDDARSIRSSDSYLAELKDLLKQHSDVPIYLRIGAEMNVWENKCTPDEFKAAFRAVSNKMRSLDHVAIVWSVAHTSTWKSDQWPYTMHDFYPGDEYVDWVGVNAYLTKHFQGRRWEGDEVFSEICFKAGYSAEPVLMIEEIVQTYGDRKPIMISECGSAYQTNGSVNQKHDEWAAARLNEMYAYIPMVYPQVKIMAYFNKKMDGEDSYYDLEGSSKLEKAYDKAVQYPWFIQGDSDNRAEVYCEKVYETITTDGTFSLGAYPRLYGEDWIVVDYYIDDQLVHSADSAPYTVDFVGLKGNHTLRVVATGSNPRVAKRTYAEKTYKIKNVFNPTEADDFSDTAGLSSQQKKAVDYVVANGIVTGYDDGTLRPDSTITRAEFATMICRLKGYSTGGKCSFDDAHSHWGSEYIQACVKAGAINGIGGNSFAPDSNITFEQAVKIVTVVSGMADEDAAYPDGFIEAAEDGDALDNLTSVRKGRALSRIDAAVLMYNVVK